MNVDLNCRKFLGSLFAVLQRCGNLSEPALCEIVLTKCLPILMYGVECFSLLVEQKRKLCVAFNKVIGRIFKLLRYTSVSEVIVYIGSKPYDILVDEKRFFIFVVLFGKYL